MEKEELKELAEEVSNIRHQIESVLYSLPMTRQQIDSFETVKNRLWKVCQKLDAKRLKMTPLPKHLEEMLKKYSLTQLGWENPCCLRHPILQANNKDKNIYFASQVEAALEIMLKDMESMAKALESIVGSEADFFGDNVAEALKNYREKYGVRDDQST